MQDRVRCPRADTTYPLQHTIDVGDVPGHQVRIFELKRKVSNAQANCEWPAPIRWSGVNVSA